MSRGPEPDGHRRAAVTALVTLTAGLLAVIVAILLQSSSEHHAPHHQTTHGEVPVPPVRSPLLAEDARIVTVALRAYRYRAGEWMPSRYSSPNWEKYQGAALAAAALGVGADGGAGDRLAAEQTVNTAIATHQRPDGDFDNGTAASGSSGVNGGFWVEVQGLIALTLARSIPVPLLRAWEQSMARYERFLEASHDAAWYTNGNVVLRQALIMLETNRLARLVKDPDAALYWRDYLAERRFLVNPVGLDGHGDPLAWRSYGEYNNGHGGLWFDESTSSGPFTRLVCANGQVPCQGFDGNYTTAQLNDAIIAYTVGGDDSFWLRVLRGEYAALRTRISHGTVDAGRGSRDDIPSEVFYPPIYAVLERQGGGGYQSAWAEQLKAAQAQLRAYGKQADPGGNAYSLVGSVALPLITMH